MSLVDGSFEGSMTLVLVNLVETLYQALKNPGFGCLALGPSYKFEQPETVCNLLEDGCILLEQQWCTHQSGFLLLEYPASSGCVG